MSGCGPSYDDPKAKSGGWSASGNLVAGNTLKTVTMQAVFPDAQNYTVEFNISGAVDTSGNPVQCVADITWTVEGNLVKRTVSVTNGTSLTGTGQGVRVVIRDVSVDVFGGTPLVGVQYLVGVLVSPGTRSGDKQPPTLALLPAFSTTSAGGLYLVNPATVVTVNVPQDAGIKSVMITAVNDSNASDPPRGVIVCSQGTSTSTSKIYDPRFYDWVPLSPGTTQIQLINGLPAAGERFAMSVTYGIDG